MNTKLLPMLTVASVLAIGTAAVAGEPQRGSRKTGAPSGLYTCAMHPDIRWSKPDDCPLCGMKLTAIKTKRLPGKPSSRHEAMRMDDDSRQMADHDGMAMDRASMGPMMGGCGMCMEMMDMGGMQHGTARNAAPPAAHKIAPPRHRGRGRSAGGRGCGC